MWEIESIEITDDVHSYTCTCKYTDAEGNPHIVTRVGRTIDACVANTHRLVAKMPWQEEKFIEKALPAIDAIVPRR